MSYSQRLLLALLYAICVDGKPLQPTRDRDTMLQTEAAHVSTQAASTSVTTASLSNGVKIPMLGFGTWNLSPNDAKTEVNRTLKLAHPPSIDTSPDYKNQDAVREGIGKEHRCMYFLTTKVNPMADFTPENAYSKTMEQHEENLKELGKEHVDLVLLHYPVSVVLPSLSSDDQCAIHREMWRATETFYNEKKAKAIGVSNWCPSTFDCIKGSATVTPQVNQVKLHAGMGSDPGGIHSEMKARGVLLQAYSALGSPDGVDSVLKSEALKRIGKAHGTTAASVAIRWLVQHEVAVVTTSTNTTHMQQALDSFTYELSAAEMSEIDGLQLGQDTYSFGCTS